jgi:hypothetical protein
MNSPRNIILLFLLMLAVPACNMPGSSQPAPDAIYTSAVQTVEAQFTLDAAAAAEASATPEADTPTPEPLASPTPEPATSTSESPTATSLPCNAVSFVSDVTIPDGASIETGKTFVKTWRLRNSGSCTWNSSYQLVFKTGDAMSGPASKSLTNSTVAPGQTLDISVDLTAPATPGTYKGFWELREPGGVNFGLTTGGAFWVEIKAVSPVTQPPSIPDWPIFKVNNEGPEVYALQYLLRYHGATLTADGKFGPQTSNAVKDFQSSKGLTADGIVGQQTWQALIVNTKQGNNGEHVRAIQHLLKFKFGSSIEVDGVFGTQTVTAVKNFQTQTGLLSDGIVGAQTWQALIALTP